MKTMAFPLEVKEVTDEGQVEGYASIFGNVDKGGDRVSPGAFVESLRAAAQAGRTIKMLWHHNPQEPIGVWDDLVEDATGLRVKGRLILEVARAREVHALMKAKAIGGLSIGYRTLKDSADGYVRVLEKLDLFEVSPVTFPMNERAKISGVKGEGFEDLMDKLAAGDRLTEREFERMVKGLGLSNSQAERAARVHLKGQGDPAEAAPTGRDFLAALVGRTA